MSSERPCPVCLGRSYAHFTDERIDPARVGALTYASRKPPEFMCLRLVRCKDCDLVYAPPPPAEDFLHAAYSDADFDSGPEALAAAQTYADALRVHLPGLARRNAAVDVGAGTGPLLPFLQEQGFFPVIGIEPSRAAIEAAPPAARPLLREGMFSAAMLEGETLSLITSFMTLEHLRDPGEFVSTAHGLLEPGGAIAVVVHNWRAPLNRLLGPRSPIIDVEHLQLFSPRALHELLARTGFEHIALKPIRNAYPLRYWLRLTPLPASAKRLLLRLLERSGLADRQIAMNVGNMLAVGYKPEPSK
ncbi:class I SAM-dependent methyltransferase [Pseudoduganella sp. R-32]|uniref:class I SAM-dependent methyltransferase n=1 Tax=Pseudoduganella sp. R-32 TaxID=3404061 RepID=UPI003CFA889B